MKLSDAIVLGDMLKKPDSAMWLSPDGSCGCAFGGALLAAGVTAEQFRNEWAHYKGDPTSAPEMRRVRELWPWLKWEHLGHISNLYHEVAAGTKTIEDVAAYVRTIEPPEPAETHSGETVCEMVERICK